MKNTDYSKFGFDWVFELNALELYRKDINIYIAFVYIDETEKQIETPLYMFSKIKVQRELYKNKILQGHKLKALKYRLLEDRLLFNQQLTLLKMKIFNKSSTKYDYQFYTDNRTKIPTQYIIEKKNKQKTMNFK